MQFHPILPLILQRSAIRICFLPLVGHFALLYVTFSKFQLIASKPSAGYLLSDDRRNSHCLEGNAISCVLFVAVSI